MPENKKGFYKLCPKCQKKCFAQPVGEDGWVIECVKCDILIDED